MLKKKNYQNEVNEAVKFYQTGNYQKTIEILIQLEKKVRDPNISWILANTFFKLHHYSASLEQTQKFIKLKNKDPINLNFLGNIFLETNQIQKALKTFNEVLSLDKSNKSAILNLIKIYLNTGKIKKSEDYLKELLKKEPENYGYHHSLIRIDKNYLDQISIDDLETNMNHLKENNLIYSKLILAKKMELKKDYKSEIENLISAHKLYINKKKLSSEQQYNYYLNLLPQFIEKCEKIKKIHTSHFCPIFIMGLPRSGTTLVEQIILSGNKSIQGLGETDVFDKVFFSNKLIKDYNTKKINSNFQFNTKEVKDLLNLLISQYKDQGLNKTNSLFTDKSISSFLYIELIVKIFPNAKFIYCYRDPLANILGLLRAFLPNILWSHSLDKTFNVFDFYYKKLEKIKKNKSIDIFQINLEKLTSNPQRISKDLYKFLDLKWNSNSLKINNNNFVIKTASNIQIKNHIIKHDLEYTSNYIKLFRDLGYEYSWLA